MSSFYLLHLLSSGSRLLLLICTIALSFTTHSVAAPSSQVAFEVSASDSPLNSASNQHKDLGPLEHMSGIAPYHDAPGANIEPPAGCEITAATFLFRHSSITANDDEWDDYMKPFVTRVQAHVSNAKSASQPAFSLDTPLAFLNDWQSEINDDNLEQLTGPGAQDAKQLGKRMRSLYPNLFPPTYVGKERKQDSLASTLKEPTVRVPFKLWTASSSRDIGTAKAFIKGAFPRHQEGHEGEGDGKYVTLVEVDNKNADWGASLTPHKICKAFSKELGEPNARQWLEKYGAAPLARLRLWAPTFDFQLDDVIAMQMLCGYESVIRGIGKSNFCRKGLMTMTEFKDFGYWNDLKYAASVGYEAPVAPYLGMPWLNTSVHNLLSINDDSHGFKSGSPLPPNGTHTQRLFTYFTHREEPPVVLVALGLWNDTEAGPLPTDHRPDDRAWKTSHVLPFLGHVAIERMACRATSADGANSTMAQRMRRRKYDYVRVIVNGATQPLPHCQGGPGDSCPLKDFVVYIRERSETYADLEGACTPRKARKA